MRWTGAGLGEARRILCYGVTGSGKSTFAARLSAATAIPWTEADSINWLPGWRRVPLAQQRCRVADLVRRDEWILDSCYSEWLDLVLPRVQLVIGLDYRRSVSLGRLVRRTLVRNLDRREICNGNTETWRETFSRDSILAWHFRSFAMKHNRLLAWEQDPDAPPVLRLRTRRAASGWLEEVAGG